MQKSRIRLRTPIGEMALILAKFEESLLRGESNRSKIAWENMVEDRVREPV